MTGSDVCSSDLFDLRALRRYSPKIISGWMCEDPSMAVAECAALARQEALAEIGARLGPFMPGDHHSDLRYQTTLEQENAVLTLVPVWVLAVRYRPDKPAVRLLVNGQSGAVFGRRPLSWLKVTIMVLLVLAAIVGVALALRAAR